MNLSPHKKLYQLALKYLTRREHSVLELSQKLKEKTEFPELVSEVIQELIQKKYLDDTRFAEVYSRARANKGYGLRRIKQELKERGVSESGMLHQADIKKIYEKKFGKINGQVSEKDKNTSDVREKAKQIRYLQYRGFSFDEISKVLNHDDDE